jgi:diguanylate cyclase (GGDEF)-like protein/PAS domain S-box-containing protein
MTPAEAIGSLEALQTNIDVVASPIFVKDREHRWVLLNDSMCKFVGLPREKLIGKSDFDFVPAEQAQIFWTIDDRVFLTGHENENEEEHTDLDGNVRTIVTRKRLVHVGEEEMPLLVAVITDITAFREAEAHSRYLALHDSLSGLANRTLLNDMVDKELSRMATGTSRCALLYIDLDRFKDVNDRLGHQAGDELIRQFAGRITALVRSGDTVARIVGDEFAILVSNVEEPESLDGLCERILEAAREPFEVAGMRAYVGASIGVVLAAEPDCRYTDLLRKADVALYKAKTEGRSCFRVFSEEMDERRRMRCFIESELREALAENRDLEIFYQPLYSNVDESLLGVEALVRWRHPTLGFLGPGQFVPVAEETGLIAELGEWVLAKACRTLSRWPDIALAVNVSPVQLRDAQLAPHLLDIVRKAGFDPARLQLEITENALFNADGVVACSLRDLRAAGVQIALDDFGTGYSSLAHLRRLEVDKVKIDRSFVQYLGLSADSGAIVQAVANIGKTLGLIVTAEGVETAEQREFLAQTGCTELQGYLFSRPLSEEAITELLDGATAIRRVA